MTFRKITAAAGVLLLTLSALTALELKLPENSTQLISGGVSPKTVTIECSGGLDGIRLEGELRFYGSRNVEHRAGVNAARESKLTFQVTRPGYYDMTVYARKGKETVARLDTNLAIIPAANYTRPPEMGVCVHFMQGKHKAPMKRTLELIRQAGFTRIRDDLSWAALERKPGEYQLPERFLQLIDTAPEFGLKTLIVTGYNNPVYGKHFKKSFPTTPEMYEAFGNAAAYAVKESGGRVSEWEIWNEPNSAHPANEYLPLLKVVYGKIKAAKPDVTVISCGGSGAGGGPGGGAIVPIVNAGGLEFQDAFSIHPYMSPSDPDFGYKANGGPISRVSVPEFSRHLGNFINARPKADGSKLKLYVTEIGWCIEHPAARQIPVTTMTQAAFLARTYLLFRAQQHKAEGIYWYDFQNDGTDAKEKEHNFGLIRLDYSPKPAYQAAAVVASMLRDRPFQNAITEGKITGAPGKDALKDGSIKLYLYGKPGDRMLACWTAPMENHARPKVEFKLPLPYVEAKLTDWQGKELKMPPLLPGNRIELQLDYLPQYITRKGN